MILEQEIYIFVSILLSLFYFFVLFVIVKCLLLLLRPIPIYVEELCNEKSEPSELATPSNLLEEQTSIQSSDNSYVIEM